MMDNFLLSVRFKENSRSLVAFHCCGKCNKIHNYKV